jgi:hypothetical protein
MKKIILAAALALAPFSAAAQQAPPQQQGGIVIQDVKVQLFLEKSGKFSENIVGAKRNLTDVPTGGGDAGEPAESILVTIVFQGPKNGRGSDKLARDLAAVKVVQNTKTGPKILLNRPYGGMMFGEDGLNHKAFILDNATCWPIEIEARVGRSRKTAKVDFSCSPPAAN